MDKTVINTEYTFTIKPIRAGGLGIFLTHPSYNEERGPLVVCHCVSECKDWIFKYFIGERETHINIVEEVI